MAATVELAAKGAPQRLIGFYPTTLHDQTSAGPEDPPRNHGWNRADYLAIKNKIAGLAELAELDKDLNRSVESSPDRIEPEAGFERPDSAGRTRAPVRLPSKVLLVDDERDFVETLSERFRLRDVGTRVVFNGEAALAALAAEEPEVMVLDLRMPGLNGAEILREIKTSYPAVEVIILTGHGSLRDREECLEIGAFAFLQKPADFEELSEMMSQAADKRRGG